MTDTENFFHTSKKGGNNWSEGGQGRERGDKKGIPRQDENKEMRRMWR